MGYHWLLKEEFKRQVQTIAQLEARKKAADESILRRAGLSSYGGSSSRGNEYLAKKRQSRMAHLTEQESIEAVKVLDFGSIIVDTRGNVVPRTPQAAVTAATMYLLNNQPPARDPRTAMHRSTIAGLGLIEATLDKEPVPDPKKGKALAKRYPSSSSSDDSHDLSRRRRSRRHDRDYDARDELTQRKIDKSRARRARSTDSEEEDGELYGARCFSRSIRQKRMPKGFKLPSENPKFDGPQDPKIWLEDHISSVRLHGGSRSTAMQYLQLQLQGVTRAWLNNLPRESIRSWDELVYSFVH